MIYEPAGRAREYSLLALNLFTGCVHGCDYCYVPKTLHVNPDKFRTKVKPREEILERLRWVAHNFKGTNKRVLLCFSCDPYQPEKIEHGVTRQALRILREFDIPFQILTKGGLRAARDFDLYGPKDAFASTMTLTPQMSKSRDDDIEPKAESHLSRIAAIKEAKKRGINTWISLEPVLNAIQSLCLIAMTHSFVDHFKIGKLNYQKIDVDWRKFGIEAIELCEKYGTPYYIKDDLAKYLGGVEYTNTDTRLVKRK